MFILSDGLSVRFDSEQVNPATAAELGVFDVGCTSHKLNLAVEQMVNENASMASVIDSIRKSMSECKLSTKSMSMLRNVNLLSPVLFNETRWSGKFEMLKRFLEIRNGLISIAEETS